ncbi:MAG: alpha/beta fold hydrolase [Anaerolineales bacterium]|nr:alpha/beta fold hydrolase [Anaerolineales bacterium]
MASGRIQPNRGLILAASLTLAFILLNLIAYRQARAMLTFTQTGKRTAAPESLSVWQKVKMLFTGINIPKPLNSSKPDSWNLTFTVHRFKVTEVVELEAWHIPHFQAKGLILLFHGYASSKSSLLPEAKAFHELGYTTFLVDFRGSGDSNSSQTSIGFYEADDVAKAFEYAGLLAGDQPMILYGRSMGGAAVLRAISVYHIQPAGVILEAVFDNMLSTVQNRFRAMGLPSFPAAQLLVFWGSHQNGSSGFRHNPVEYAAGVQCPALMLHGTDDPRATLAEGRAVFNRLGGKKWFEAFTGVGHEAYLAVEPEQWKQSVTLFLGRLHHDIT